MIDAGNAALQMGDPVAALGFFARADAISSQNAQVKAGLGSALLGNENPFEAINMFNQADQLGIGQEVIALDRGLAYDLIGKQNFAQQDYRFLLSRNGNNPEAIRRFALSLGIIGKRKEAESLLTPLLYANDRAAWRIRAFVLAINKDIDGALAITRGSLPPDAASSIEPFFRYMPKLTPSQQAAAAHFGHFPQEANIGRDNPRVGEYAALDRSRTQNQILTNRADAGLIPAGEPLGSEAKNKAKSSTSRKPRRRPGRKERDPAKINKIVNAADKPKAVAAAPVAPIVQDKATNPGFTILDDSENAINLAKDIPAPAPKANIADVGSAIQPASKPSAKPAPKSFAELMRGIDVPSEERARNENAVDITAITPAKPKPKANPKPKPKPKVEEPPKPEHPSRHWVQVAGGADSSALKAEWHRLTRKAPDVFDGMKGWTTPLNKTNRVLAGPFDSKKAAQAFVNTLAKEDISAFTFTSDKGQVINKLN